jgi:integrase
VTAAGTTARRAGAPLRPRMRPEAASALLEKFPPRTVPDTWEATALSRAALTGRLLGPPYAESPWTLKARRTALSRFLAWLERHPGDTWQQRWQASGIAGDGQADWRPAVMDWLAVRGDTGSRDQLLRSVTSGLGQLIYADAVRPGVSWLLGSPIRFPLGREVPRLRDSAGFAALEGCAARAGISHDSRRLAVEHLSVIIAAKGGTLADITVGDCLELMEIRDSRRGTLAGGRGNSFYQLLHAMGLLPTGAPATLRMLDPRFQGQLTTAELIGQYDLACGPVRDLLTCYLDERQPSVDYATLKRLAYLLGKLFWKDLEAHNPGISSLRLAPDAVIAWKRRLSVKTVTARDADGNVAETTSERIDAISCLTAVRALYLDIAQWAAADPARWARWAVPSPVRKEDISPAKMASRRKSRMDQRTRERIPVLPALITAVDQARKDAAARLAAATAAAPGNLFTVGGATMRKTVLTSAQGQANGRTWAEDPVTGTRRDLTRAEDSAFWTWAAVEVLRATGLRLEELTELSHHSLVQYRLPSTGELIPLLHVAPSKSDAERLLVISPELADVLAAVIARVRDSAGIVPLVVAYDVHECEFTPPMPVLFQHHVGADSRPVSAATIRRWITSALEGTGITDASGQLLAFKPHDFRRIFATDAIMNGMPPHICQLLMGHASITTTMGYKAVYPEEAISGHRAFIARRRELRPSEEYRAPTDSEWEEFLGHFERRRLALGDCGRAWGSSCIHEHSCIRCSLLRVDPAQKQRLEDIRGNLTARIAEAEREGWAGEAAGLKVSLAAASNKLAQIELALARRAEAVSLGMPSYRDTAASVITAVPSPETCAGTP